MGEPTVIMTVRHGQTDFNHQKRYAGRLDVPLNDKGVRDAAAAAQNLTFPVDVVVSSPLVRAAETARLLVGDAHEVITSELCMERDFGVMQGLTSDEVERVRPVIAYFRAGGDFHSLNPAQGETFPALRRRARSFAADVTSQFAGRRILVVSHEVFLLQLHGLLRAETWQEAMRHRLPNLVQTTFTMQDGRLVTEDNRPLVPAVEDDGSFFGAS